MTGTVATTVNNIGIIHVMVFMYTKHYNYITLFCTVQFSSHANKQSFIVYNLTYIFIDLVLFAVVSM